MARRKVSFIEAAIPLNRGVARHYENNENIAQTVFDKDDKVKEIHTPQDALRRVHEVMHARYTNPKDYKNRRSNVRDIIEDCRLHLNHWLWPNGDTPQVIADDVDLMFKLEKKRRIEAKKEFDRIDPFSDFAQILRENCVRDGMRQSSRKRKKYTTWNQENLADQLIDLIRHGKHNEAAYMLESAFFAEEMREEEERRKVEARDKGEDEDREKGDEEGEGEKGEGDDEDGEGDEDSLREGLGHSPPRMDIIELPLIEDTFSFERGFRMTTSGSRIYRPALRRPILPQRLFLKQSPIAPGGAILFDASGSMGVSQSMLLDCCRRTPAATVAFYSGEDGGNCGTLYVYAKEGRRASGNPAEFPSFDGGNGCDGLAMDWLMKQEGPRIMVTDKRFTCDDSVARVVQLDVLEELGEITVYHHYHKFFEEFPQIELAA